MSKLFLTALLLAGSFSGTIEASKAMDGPSSAPLPSPWEGGNEVPPANSSNLALALGISIAFGLQPATPEEIVADLLSGELALGSERLDNWSEGERSDLVRAWEHLTGKRLTEGSNVGIAQCRNLADAFDCSAYQIRLQMLYIQKSSFLATHREVYDRLVDLNEGRLA